MTRFTRTLAVLGAVLPALALAAGVPVASLAQTPVPVVVLDLTVAPTGRTTQAPSVDFAAVRAELGRALHAFVVAPSGPEVLGVTPVATVRVHLSADSATLVVLRLSPSGATQDTQELTFQGNVSQARLIGLVLALVEPWAAPPQAAPTATVPATVPATAPAASPAARPVTLAAAPPTPSAPAWVRVNLQSNPYLDDGVTVAALGPMPATTRDAFMTPNPYLSAGPAAASARASAQMPLGQNPYR